MKTRIKLVTYSDDKTKYVVQTFRLREIWKFEGMLKSPILFWGYVSISIPYFIFYLIDYVFLWEDRNTHSSLENAKKEIDEIYSKIDAINKQKERFIKDKIEKQKSKKVIKKTYLKYP